MEKTTGIGETKKLINTLKEKELTIGFVPTMGYLHRGHLSLMEIAKRKADIVFISIFVNPTQFGPSEDFEKYPRDFERDWQLAEKAGVDYIFYPGAKEIYPQGYKTYVQVKELDSIMCGKNRPGHFTGVCTVVLKLFNIIKPDFAFFGQKDYQQLVIIKKMSRDLNLDVEIVLGKTVREKDGLAISSRNKYLSPRERKNAPVLYRSLKLAESALKKGKGPIQAKEEALGMLKSNRSVKNIDYLDIRCASNLDQVLDTKQKNDILIAGAIWMGNTRLIDNIIYGS
ncbi:MAG: pantoate--beta-alanine ligase [Actinomycetota bacterium]